MSHPTGDALKAAEKEPITELCDAIRPGKKSQKVHGCCKEKGHKGLHQNGQNVMWMQDKQIDAGRVKGEGLLEVGEAAITELEFWAEHLEGMNAPLAASEVRKVVDKLSAAITREEGRLNEYPATSSYYAPNGQIEAGSCEWTLRYADADIANEVFNSEAEGIAAWNKRAPNWNCTLTGPVRRAREEGREREVRDREQQYHDCLEQYVIALRHVVHQKPVRNMPHLECAAAKLLTTYSEIITEESR